jgi:hypothetical protein
MYARVSSVQMRRDKVAEAERNAQQGGTNPIANEPGFLGNMTLYNRETGKAMTVGLWDTREHLDASAHVNQAGLDQLAQAGMFASTPTIEVFEVLKKTDAT